MKQFSGVSSKSHTNLVLPISGISSGPKDFPTEYPECMANTTVLPTQNYLSYTVVLFGSIFNWLVSANNNTTIVYNL
jgi:hypothetical protein